ncbi:homoaconitase, partial [bacterium]|nr:homoaconitase [bacterium]
IMVEEGYAWPGSLVVASDSHSNMYGGVGCLGTPIVRTDAAAIWATGRTWWQVPPVAKVKLQGKLRPGVTGKDVILALCGHFNQDEVLNHVIEFTGDGVAGLSVSERLTIANMTTEWGALAGVFPIDDVLIDWYKARAEFIAKRGFQGVPSDADGNGMHPRFTMSKVLELDNDRPAADGGASYARVLTFNLDSVQPYVSGPNSVKVMTPVVEMSQRNVKIHKAYLLSCVNARVDDLSSAAKIMRGKKVADGVEFYIAAASSEVQAESEAKGDWQALLDAGAIALPPGCGACIGLGAGLLQEGEVGISATNRNFKGRMGSREAEAFLASPAVVAASAIAGKFDYPGAENLGAPQGEIVINPRKAIASSEIDIIDGFPPALEGELIFCYQDNLNTDGIYPGKYTYIDDFTPAQQAAVVMENYDTDFGQIVKENDILVGAYTFGTGSSREQAATALKYRGIQLVIAGSFSQTYLRNALNNGFLALTCPDLVDDLKAKFGTDKLTVRTEMAVKIDFRNSTLTTAEKSYAISPIGTAAQELIVTGGLESWVKSKL